MHNTCLGIHVALHGVVVYHILFGASPLSGQCTISATTVSKMLFHLTFRHLSKGKEFGCATAPGVCHPQSKFVPLGVSDPVPNLPLGCKEMKRQIKTPTQVSLRW